jgi:flagellar hook assembly protein FlgD
VVNDNGGAGDYSLAVQSGIVGLAAGGSPSFVTELTGVAPNPTSGPARIDFELRQPARVDLAITDVAGRSVAEIVPRDWPSGRWSESWAGRDRAGRPVPAGVYWVRMTVGGREVSGQKLLVVR